MRKNTANIITVCRILCSVIMMFLPVFSFLFYIAYAICGLSDITDGIVARKTNSDSEFGAKLDTIADFVFAAAAIIKLLPIIPVPKWAWLWICTIAVIKTANIIFVFICKKRFAPLHTNLNKLTGLLLFIFPFVLNFARLEYCLVILCSVATLSAIWEGYCIIQRE